MSEEKDCVDPTLHGCGRSQKGHEEKGHKVVPGITCICKYCRTCAKYLVKCEWKYHYDLENEKL